jgi:hypothetical protein
LNGCVLEIKNVLDSFLGSITCDAVTVHIEKGNDRLDLYHGAPESNMTWKGIEGVGIKRKRQSE